MLSIRPLDPVVPLHQQLQCSESPVVLVNLFTVDQDDIPDLLRAWELDANWMKQQAGYISTQLHQAIGGSCMFLNYAVWESVERFREAFNHPDFANALGRYPSSALAMPHLFTKVAVPNICTA
ncbi:antibiotic biosynthesis monooxygenase [Pseudomonas protegens]|uniref:antibiotic biosynthesis monooxygenase family protein n=1 Tax=Pseudomonas protegens TaxID=380021 RepID=UPI0013734E96|nr:antibiotic biosynthesis monooxygenase family protein [Pseudomonas protegens]NAN55839.1 antibiotic biosynthesis monooxygenase [Pseudomonas protegens]NUE78733.1 antibiotic biosynthesis monooxygenase [Pseudomonas protegens]